MIHISKILQNTLARIRERRAISRANRRAARLEKIKQHWQAGSIGGGASVQLGWMTRSQAIRAVEIMRTGPVVFIDDERGFIAFGNPPESLQ